MVEAVRAAALGSAGRGGFVPGATGCAGLGGKGDAGEGTPIFPDKEVNGATVSVPGTSGRGLAIGSNLAGNRAEVGSLLRWDMAASENVYPARAA